MNFFKQQSYKLSFHESAYLYDNIIQELGQD